ncbi:RNA-binding (RRM/RBD/RNP motifs) family protein [Thalictrum thalictroides]|uniref:RNA-binding (RRM/RBD/RNP motifs) family protein n=1 Tax=Thalictrum thalictroides TaxID=46969 RepID=A0A7J6XE41_THATH|nr:RNA-binding (RRM/RBD/RNP motifs) family protein [Thalictrum thalictroides]
MKTQFNFLLPILQFFSHGFERDAVNVADTKKMNASAHYVPQNSTPCPTLFMANLAPTCAEQELIEVFSRCPGFLKLKMQNKNGAPVAFVDFQDVTCSAKALNNLQDAILYTSPGKGMWLEYPFE